MPDRWLTIAQAAELFGGHAMRVYRRIWAGELVVSNIARTGRKPIYRVSEASIAKYFADRVMKAPTRGLAR